jgi:LacI family transcriptional regulator
MNRNRITIADVAAAAGVSLMTVSRAMNDREGIHPETRERILKIAEKLGYHPSQIARGLVTHQTATLGLVMPDVANPFFAQIARGAEEIAYKNGYNLFLINTAEDLNREKNALNSLLEKEIDGAVLCSSRLSQIEMMPYLENLPATVLVNRTLEEPPRVATFNVNDCRGTQQAVDYLIAHGRQTIALIAGPENSVSSKRRLNGYQRGLREQGLPCQEEQILHCSPTTLGGEEAALRLFAQLPHVDAVIAFNDLVAVGVLRACLQTHRSIPAQVAVIGADDIPLAALTNPSLTTLHVDQTALGEQAMTTLLHLMYSEETAKRIVLEPKLTIRQSA